MADDKNTTPPVAKKDKSETDPVPAPTAPAATDDLGKVERQVEMAEAAVADAIGEVEAKVKTVIHEGPRNWAEMKAWIRRELDLHAVGVDHNERELQNP